MSNKLKKKSNIPIQDEKQDGIVKEAWDNMNNDLSRFLPSFLSARFKRKKGTLGSMVLILLVELLILGVIGKFLYDWLIS